MLTTSRPPRQIVTIAAILTCSAAHLAISETSVIRTDELALGPFQPTDESQAKYQDPEWFRDAKFDIWTHWGPQAVPRMGDSYARQLYVTSRIDKKTGQEKGPSSDYQYHLEHYGHPSVFGYKDKVPAPTKKPGQRAVWRPQRRAKTSLHAR